MTSVVSPLLQIPGLELVKKIGSGAQADVYLAKRDGVHYAVKLFRTKSVQALRREARTLARVRHRCVPAVMEVGDCDGSPYIVMEFVDGQPLTGQIKLGALPERQIVAIAAHLADALAVVHGQGQLHRDIKPDNILIDQEGMPRLTDFGLAGSVAGEERGAGGFVGSAAYVSPEGAGMVKRAEDGRSDLYSLGVVLYEAATGRRPFLSDDVAELLRMHAAVVPEDPRKLNSSLSTGLAAAIMRLLAKDPDARYSSAQALAHDLRRIDDITAALAAGETDGQLDESGDRLGIDLPLVGRVDEKNTLHKLWRDVGSGKGAALLVEGEAGTGKSRLIRELLPVAHRSSALILTSKASDSDLVPFSALRQALDGRLRRLRWMPETTRASFVAQMREAAAGSAESVALLSPLVAQTLGVAATTQAASENLRDIIAGFFAKLAQLTGPVLFLVDDVQWLDESSRAVLATIARRAPELPLLIAFTSRSAKESGEGYKLFLSSVDQRLAAHMRLSALDKPSAAELVSVYLGGTPVDAGFVDKLFTRSQGNPFVLMQYVATMLDEGLIRPSWGTWQIDLSAIDKLSLSSDVSELLNRRIDALSASSREVLVVAALFGSGFQRDLVLRLTGLDPSAIDNGLAECVRASLIEPVLDGGYAFVHDRIRESLVRRIDGERRRDLHQAIAEALSEEGGADQAVALAFHLTRGRPDKDPARLTSVCRDAAIELQRQGAYEEALSFLQIAEEGARNRNVALDAAFYGAMSLSLERTRQFNESLEALAQALSLETDQERRTDYIVRSYYVRSASNLPMEWDLVESEMATSKIAGVYGRKLPVMLLTALPWFILGLLSLKTGIGHGTAKGESRAWYKNAARLYEACSWVAYHQADPLRYTAITIRMAWCAARLGSSPEAANALSGIALLASQFDIVKLWDFCKDHTRRMFEQTGDRTIQSALIWSNTITRLLTPKGDPVTFAEVSEGELRKNAQWMQAQVWKNLVDALQLSYALRGLHDEVLRWDVELAERAPEARSFAMLALAATGRHEEAATVHRETHDYVLSQPRHAVCVGLFTSAAMGYYYFAPKSDEGDIDAVVSARKALNLDPKFTLYPLAFYFISRSYLLLDRYRQAPEHERQVFLAEARGVIAEFKQMPPFALLHTHLKVLLAALAAIDGKEDEASKLLMEGQEMADRLSVPWASFEVERLRARLLLKQGKHGPAQAHVTQAVALAGQYGWVTLQQSMYEEFGELARSYVSSGTESRSSTRSRTTGASSSSGGSFAEALQGRKLDALMAVSRACSTTVDREQLGRIAVDEALKIMGAQRAFLFIADPETGELRLAAKAEGEGAPEGTHSRTIVNRVWASRGGVVSTASEDGDVLTSESAVAQGLRSVIAAPLILQDSVRGVIYLDSTLVSGLFTGHDLEILQAIATQVAAAFETAHVAGLQAHRAALEKDLALTGAVQSLLLPDTTTGAAGSVAFAGFSKPADKSGGDWWWHTTTDDGKLIAFVGDVTGHGAGSAMVTATFAGMFHALWSGQKGPRLDDMLPEMSRFYAELCGASYSLAFTALEVDGATGAFRYWPGGLPPALLMRGATGGVEVLGQTGAPFSSKVETSFACGEGKLEPGDRLLTFTDGIPEVEKRGRQIGLKGVSRILTATKAKPLEDAREHIVEVAKDLMEGWKIQDDDVTFVLLERK